MDTTNWVIIVDGRRANGMLEAARNLGGDVVAAVVGPRSLADRVSMFGFDRLLWFETGDTVPPEAYAGQVAEAAKAAAPRLVMTSDSPVGRVVLGTVAAALGAPLIGAVRALSADAMSVVVSRATAEGRAWEDLEASGPAAIIYDGDDAEAAPRQRIPVQRVPLAAPRATLRLIEVREGDEDAGLQNAARVVGVGAGLRAKEDLALVEKLAAVLNAELGCSLPISEDMRWLASDRIVGATHHQIAPDLYLAVGISGQPVHMAGVRDAKVVVAINNDPEAKIFRSCSIGIVGDLYKVLPPLISALETAV